MEIDLNELERLANAATPGPWIACGPSFGASSPKYLNEVVVDNPEDDENDGNKVCRPPVGLEDAVSADMEFIGAANPAIMLELVRRLRAAESALDAAQARVKEDRDALIVCHRNPATGLRYR